MSTAESMDRAAIKLCIIEINRELRTTDSLPRKQELLTERGACKRQLALLDADLNRHIPDGGEPGQVMKITEDDKVEWFNLFDGEAIVPLQYSLGVDDYTFTFTGLSSDVIIEHGLNRVINSTIMVDALGRVVYPTITVIDINSIQVCAGEVLTGYITVS